jgi:hypothetical protein
MGGSAHPRARKSTRTSPVHADTCRSGDRSYGDEPKTSEARPAARTRMSSSLLQIAILCVRAWTQFYTLHVPAHLRDTRRAEIESDLWEFQHDRAHPEGAVAAAHLLLRLLLGIPADLSWRAEQIHRDQSRLRTTSVAATIAGVLLIALWILRSTPLPSLPQPPRSAIRDVALTALPPPPPPPPPRSTSVADLGHNEKSVR